MLLTGYFSVRTRYTFSTPDDGTDCQIEEDEPTDDPMTCVTEHAVTKVPIILKHFVEKQQYDAHVLDVLPA